MGSDKPAETPLTFRGPNGDQANAVAVNGAKSPFLFSYDITKRNMTAC